MNTLPPDVPRRKERQAKLWTPAGSSTMGMFTANHPCCSTFQHSAELGHRRPWGHGREEGCDPWQIGKSLPLPTS